MDTLSFLLGEGTKDKLAFAHSGVGNDEMAIKVLKITFVNAGIDNFGVIESNVQIDGSRPEAYTRHTTNFFFDLLEKGEEVQWANISF